MPVTTLVRESASVQAGSMPLDDVTRFDGLVTSLSWIPSEAVESAQRIAFDTGMTHYDPPPPAEGLDLEELRAADRFRFANELRGWIEVDASGRISNCGYSGGGLMGAGEGKVSALSHRRIIAALRLLHAGTHRRAGPHEGFAFHQKTQRAVRRRQRTRLRAILFLATVRARSLRDLASLAQRV